MNVSLGVKEIFILLIVATPIAAAYPIYSDSISKAFPDFNSFDDVLPSGSMMEEYGDDVYVEDHESYDDYMEVIFLRDRVLDMVEKGLLPPAIADEAYTFAASITEESLMEMSYLEIEMVKERLEHYLEFSGLDDDGYEYAGWMGLNRLEREISEALIDVQEYRFRAEALGVEDVLKKLDEAESLLLEAQTLLEESPDNFSKVYQLYIEAEYILEYVDEYLEHVWGDD